MIGLFQSLRFSPDLEEAGSFSLLSPLSRLDSPCFRLLKISDFPALRNRADVVFRLKPARIAGVGTNVAVTSLPETTAPLDYSDLGLKTADGARKGSEQTMKRPSPDSAALSLVFLLTLFWPACRHFDRAGQ